MVARSHPTRSGPRAQVLGHVARFVVEDDPPTWTENPPNTLPKPQTLPRLDVGDVRLYSYYAPGLADGTYNATITQTIKIPDQPIPITQISTKTFRVVGPRWSLDPKTIHSVYPPLGHADYARILPQIVFTDPQIPWTVEVESFEPQAPMRAPWLGLIALTEQELTTSAAHLSALHSKLGTKSLSQNPSSKAYQLLLSDLVNLEDLISQPVPLQNPGIDYTTSVNAVMLPSTLFDSLFPATTTGTTTTAAGLTTFKYMGHVRDVNVLGTSNRNINEVGDFSVLMSPRPGPLGVTKPNTVFVHLVSLRDVSRINIPSGKEQNITALISLYSWFYSCIPDEQVSVRDTFRNIGTGIQPLRVPDGLWDIVNGDPKVQWTRERAQNGYSLSRYRTRTGQATVTIIRGPLVPVPTKDPLATNFPQQSNFGSDLAVLNKDFGILDLTYQLAWQLGRAVAISDRSFAGALVRLRTVVHEQSLAATKIQTDKNFVDNVSTIKSLTNTFTVLKGAHSSLAGAKVLDFTQRWKEPPLGQSPRDLLNFRRDDIQQLYGHNVANFVPSLASCTGSGPYNEFNTPTSTDYAIVLSWCLDRYFLHDVPYHYLIQDPRFLPKESLRTFYIDENWVDVFIDGALSLGNYYAKSTDWIRSSIKQAFKDYRKNPLPSGTLPQIPRWGFFLRSSLVTKFPDLRISAPRQEENDAVLDLLRMETLDTDLLMCLFDRVPDDGGFPSGITIQPPEHQLTFELGTDLSSTVLNVKWKKVYADATVKQDYSPNSLQLPPSSYTSTEANGPFDFEHRCLRPLKFANEAHTSQKPPSWPGNPSSNVVDATPSLVGAQLLSEIPQLYISGSSTTAAAESERRVVAAPSEKIVIPGPKSVVIPTVPFLKSKPVAVAPARTATAFRGLILGESPQSAMTAALGTPLRGSSNAPLYRMFGKSPFLRSLPQTADLVPLQVAVLPKRATAPGDLDPQLSLTFGCGASFIYGVAFANALFPSGVPILARLADQADYDYIFSLVSTTTDDGYFLEYAEIRIPVGTRTTDLFAPFPTGQEALDTAQAKLAKMSPVTPSTAMAWNWPLKPTHSYAGVKLPKVRAWSRGQKWIAQAQYEADDGAPPGCGSLVVDIVPRTVAGRWNVNSCRELSFVVENPTPVNWSLDQTYTVTWIEKYRDWPGNETLSGIARSSLVVTARNIPNPKQA